MWSNDVILEFLELYRTEQLLWDPKHPLHRNRSEVNDAWLRIQSALSVNFSIVDLKKKKESLMTSFRMHWNKKRKSQDYRTTWFAFPSMECFLSEKYVCSTNDLEEEVRIGQIFERYVLVKYLMFRETFWVIRSNYGLYIGRCWSKR